jgi:hypothetical protein
VTASAKSLIPVAGRVRLGAEEADGRDNTRFFNGSPHLRWLDHCRVQAEEEIADCQARAGSIAPYPIATSVSRAILASAVLSLFRASVSAVKFACFRAFRLPLGAPPPAPCIRKTLDPAPPELGTAASSASIWRGIATPGA